MKLKILVSAIVSIIIWPASITAQSELIPMIEIPAGNFYMGTLGGDENYDEAPMHKVHISKPFKMGLTEVTNAQYELFCPEHKLLRGKNGFSSEDDEAVVFVTYQDAVAFCDWLTRKEGKTYRLPTEAEWEYACKAGRYWNFYMDDKLPAAWQKNQVIAATPKPLSLKVAQTLPNEWGLYDMCGNVEEWCLDWYGPYIDKEQTDPVGYSDGMARVTRGGSHNTPVKYLRSANRMAMLPEDKHAMTGFRVVQAEYPQTAPLSQPKDEYAVSQIKWDWTSQCITEPVFTAPLVYVHEPDAHSGTPFFKHNHQPALTWCDNGDKEQTDPVGYSDGMARVTRGGSHNTPVKYLRSANRMAMLPEDKHAMTGFRVVQAEYPQTAPLSQPKDEYAVSQIKWDWTSQCITEPVFTAPLVYVHEPDAHSGTPFFKHNHQPALTWCDNGDLLAVWFSTNEEKGREMVVLSSRLCAGSREWEKSRMFYQIADRNLTGTALLNDRQGTLYHINGVEAAGHWQNLMMTLRTSTDNGQTWSKPRMIAPEHTKRHQVIAGTSITKEGWFVQACDAGPGGRDGAAVHISKDKGKTWTDPWNGAPLPDFKEGGTGTTIAGIHAGVVQLKDGRLMALGRNNSIRDKEGRLRMPMSVSDDMGKTWHYSASEFPPIDGGQRLVLMRLNEGPILLISFTEHPYRTPKEERGMMFTDKSGKPFKGYGMYAALSYDEGKTWPVKRLLTDGTYRFLNGGAWTQFFEMDENHAEPRGYLAGTQTPDNMIHLITSRFYYKFNLAWLKEN